MSHTDQDTYRETLESIVEQVIRPAAARIDETGSFPSEAMKALAHNGLLGLISATEVGGSGHGLRAAVLAVERVAREHWEEELVLAGLVGLQDPPRREVPEAVARCRAAGVRVIMVTGDHPNTALAVARETGLAANILWAPTDPLRALALLGTVGPWAVLIVRIRARRRAAKRA